MSATLGTYLQELQPDWSMTMVERLDGVAQESSNGWNAGTGHSALMELNYTPQKKDGSISIEKAVEINEAFQFSPVLVSPGQQRRDARPALLHQHRAAHELCVGRAERQLPARALRRSAAEHAVPRMKYSEDHAQIKEWAPLVMEGRDPNQKVAATRTEIGTDVNYGEITRQLVTSLKKKRTSTCSSAPKCAVSSATRITAGA
jgi:malate dehydrogenase (quinone)